MTQSDQPSVPLDPAEIVREAAALAAHLQRSGLNFLPVARADAVARLSVQFAQPSPEPITASAAESKTPPTASAPSQPAASPSTAMTRPSENAPSKPVRSASPPKSAETGHQVAAVQSANGSYPGEGLSVEQRQTQLEVIQSEVTACVRCEVLAGCRTNTVFGEGNASPRVVFFGEAPGADEDRTGRPFIGKAGQLLTKMIEACTFPRADVYILNTVKCRPPGNRNPELDELVNCREYYERQLAVLRPEYIVCLGAIAAQELLKSKLPVGMLRGKFHGYFDSKVLVTYHPSYLLRNPSAKKATWQDLQLMLKDAGINLS